MGVHLFSVDELSIQKEITAAVPDIAEVTLQKKWPREIIVSLITYPIVAVMEYGEKRYPINENGYAIIGASLPEQATIIRYADTLPEESHGFQLITPEYFSALMQAANYADISGFSLEEIRYLRAAREVRLTLTAGTELWLALEQSVVETN